MGVEVRPFGVKCNIGCQYCYQNPERDAGNVLSSYDLEKMKAAIDAEGEAFTLFGGEPLLMPVADLEQLWAHGLERFGSNHMQTNGTLVTDEHVRLFQRYKVRVGVSVDGPGELNDVRWAGTLEKTRLATEKTHAAIEALCAAGIPPSLIITLHRGNATAEKLPAMHAWIRRVEGLGVRSARLHTLEVDHGTVRAKYQLTPAENLEALLSFDALERDLEHLRFDVFKDMKRLLRGDDRKTTCIWNACDPYTTVAVQGIEGNGQRSNCGRTNKDGIDFVKANVEGFERYLALYHTPQAFGGCKGCRFFLMCKGHCPGTSEESDWRNRTEDCETLKALFRHFEDELLDAGTIPVSAQPIRSTLERGFVKAWSNGRNTTMARLLGKLEAKRKAAEQREAAPAATQEVHP